MHNQMEWINRDKEMIMAEFSVTFPTWWWPFLCRVRETSPRAPWPRDWLWDRRWRRRLRRERCATDEDGRRRRRPTRPTPARLQPWCTDAGIWAASSCCRARRVGRPWRWRRAGRRAWLDAALETAAAAAEAESATTGAAGRWRSRTQPERQQRRPPEGEGWTGAALATSWRWSRKAFAVRMDGKPSRIARKAGWSALLVRNAFRRKQRRRRRQRRRGDDGDTYGPNPTISFCRWNFFFWFFQPHTLGTHWHIHFFDIWYYILKFTGLPSCFSVPSVQFIRVQFSSITNQSLINPINDCYSFFFNLWSILLNLFSLILHELQNCQSAAIPDESHWSPKSQHNRNRSTLFDFNYFFWILNLSWTLSRSKREPKIPIE